MLEAFIKSLTLPWYLEDHILPEITAVTAEVNDVKTTILSVGNINFVPFIGTRNIERDKIFDHRVKIVYKVDNNFEKLARL
jgi:precorrin-2 methylase